MPQESSNVKDRDQIKLRPPKKFNVVFHNDDFTPMDLVVFILVEVFNHSFSEAENLMLKVHHQGKAKVGEYSYDIALSKSAKATAIAREYNYPLRVTVEQA